MQNVTKFLMIAGLALAGCGKPSDIGRMQDEADGIARRAIPEVSELLTRLTSTKMRIDDPRWAMAPEHQQAAQTSGRAKAILDALKTELDGAPARHATLAAQGDKASDELQRQTDLLREKLRNEITIATSLIETSETYVQRTDAMPKTTAQADMPPASTP